MSLRPGDMGSQLLAARSRMQDMQDMQPMQQPMGGIAGLFDRLRSFGQFQPQYPFGMSKPSFGFDRMGMPVMGGPPPRMGGYFNPGGFFSPYQQMPRMGGGFFGGFMPRFKRKARPAMPDYSGQITSLEEKIKALQEQLAARQTGSAMPASMPASMPATRPTTASSLIPQVDPVALKELQDRVAGSGIPTPRPAPAIPMPGPSGMEGLGLDLAEIPMGRGRMGGGKTMVKPSSVERLPFVPKKLPSQIDSMGRVAAPRTRGPVNVAINSPKLGIGRLGGRMMR